jgi:hypothetical protein
MQELQIEIWQGMKLVGPRTGRNLPCKLTKFLQLICCLFWGKIKVQTDSVNYFVDNTLKCIVVVVIVYEG